MFNLVWAIHILLCVVLVFLVMLQQGKGAEAGAITGGGSSDAVFGPGGGGTFFTRLTTWLVIAFMVTSIMLVRMYNAGHATVTQEGTDLLKGSIFEEVASSNEAQSADSAKSELEQTEEGEPAPVKELKDADADGEESSEAASAVE